MKNRDLYKLEFVKNTDNKCIAVIRTDREKYIDGLSDFERAVYGL